MSDIHTGRVDRQLESQTGQAQVQTQANTHIHTHTEL